MAAAQKEATKKVLDYMESLPQWSKEICLKLRQATLSADPSIAEEWKWGPHYSSSGMVVGMGAFQKHVKVTFFNGSGLKDPQKMFNHCLDNKFSRSIRFNPGDAIDLPIFTAYVQEAIALNKKGFKREISAKTVVVPPELTAALQPHKAAQTFFEGLGYGYKKEFADHVTAAKQEKTKQNRIAKIVDLCAEQKTCIISTKNKHRTFV